MWRCKSFRLVGPWTAREWNQLLAHSFELPAANKARKRMVEAFSRLTAGLTT